MKKSTIPILIAIAILLSVAVAATYNFQTMYNPFTGKLDYHITSNMSGENLTADYFYGIYLNSTGALEWIRPEHIFDVDKADIETDLNTFVDIAGDTMTGNLIVNASVGIGI